MKWSDLPHDPCPVARGLSVIGDRWTMLIIRECFLGTRRFEQFQDQLAITRNVLANRLRKLEADGVVIRHLYSERPPRHEYRLTDKGKALYPLLVTLIDWAETHHPGQAGTSLRLMSKQTGQPLRPVLTDGTDGQPITHRTVNVTVEGRSGT